MSQSAWSSKSTIIQRSSLTSRALDRVAPAHELPPLEMRTIVQDRVVRHCTLLRLGKVHRRPATARARNKVKRPKRSTAHRAVLAKRLVALPESKMTPVKGRKELLSTRPACLVAIQQKLFEAAHWR